MPLPMGNTGRPRGPRRRRTPDKERRGRLPRPTPPRREALPERKPNDLACCGGQGCAWCAGADPPDLIALRAAVGMREFLGASWTPDGFGRDPDPAPAADAPDDIRF